MCARWHLLSLRQVSLNGRLEVIESLFESILLAFYLEVSDGVIGPFPLSCVTEKPQVGRCAKKGCLLEEQELVVAMKERLCVYHI